MKLENGAWVVRGGLATAESLINGTAEHVDVPGLVGFSVQARNGATVAELAHSGQFPNRQVSVTTAGQVRGLGLDVVPSPGHGNHATVVTELPLPSELASRLSDLFLRMDNPSRSVRGHPRRGS